MRQQTNCCKLSAIAPFFFFLKQKSGVFQPITVCVPIMAVPLSPHTPSQQQWVWCFEVCWALKLTFKCCLKRRVHSNTHTLWTELTFSARRMKITVLPEQAGIGRWPNMTRCFYCLIMFQVCEHWFRSPNQWLTESAHLLICGVLGTSWVIKRQAKQGAMIIPR